MTTIECPQFLIDFRDACVAAGRELEPRVRLSRLVKDLVADPDACAALPSDLPRLGATQEGIEVGAEATLYESEDLTLALLDTYPGVVQPAHDHRMTAIIGVFEGEEDQRLFTRHATGIRAAPGRTLGAGQVMTLGPRSIHAISAPGITARAVHVYLGPINTVSRSLFHPDTGDEVPMDTNTYYRYCRTTLTSK